MTVLRYIGKHGAFLDNVPARDLTEDDLQERELDAAELVASGLYEEEGAPVEYRWDDPEPVRKSPRGGKAAGGVVETVAPLDDEGEPEREIPATDRPDWLGMVEDAEDDAPEDGE